MKHFKHTIMATLPLLAVLSMSPSQILASETKIDPVVEIAVTEVKKEIPNPKLTALISKVDIKSILKDNSVTEEKLNKKKDELTKKLVGLKERKDIESAVVDLLVIEQDERVLKEKKALTAESEASLDKSLIEQKAAIEILLTDLEAKENVVPLAETAKVLEVKPEEKKEVLPVVTTTPKVEAPVVAKEVAVKTEEKDKHVCEADEKNKVLTKQIELLVQQQGQITQQLAGMNQMMMLMSQQNQLNMLQLQMDQMQRFTSGMANPYNNAYQYGQQFTAGNWTYNPQGRGQGSTNIFNGPNNFYPDQTQSFGPWTMRPQFEMPAPMPMPGNFGNGISYNFGQSPISSPMLPTVRI